jgi:hypothetical protein
LAFALTGKSLTLERACAAFGIPYQKRKVEHGRITEEYVTYCREDVEATAVLYRAAIEDLRRHPIELEAEWAKSPASIGKQYLRAMGVRPVLDRQRDFDPAILGRGFNAYFGGRAECRIRKVCVPIVYVDYLSMYTTVNALMGAWGLVIAREIRVDDATQQVRELLADPDLPERCFDQAFWPQLFCLVEIEPDGDILPVRAGYDPATADFGIGINPFRSQRPTWYTLADAVASVLYTGRSPRIRRAIRLVPVGRQDGLRPISIRGQVTVDPLSGDFFRQVIELRRQTEDDPSLSADEQKLLSDFLKMLASSTGYGIFAQMDRHDLPGSGVPVLVHGDGEEPFMTSTAAPEQPGPFCFPPLAAAIAGGARLMLVLLEDQVTRRGGDYAFCDTDSMGIVAAEHASLVACPGGGHRLPGGEEAIRALSWEQVQGIVDRFADLNPYDRALVPHSILKVEAENFDEDGVRRPLWCYSISAKRYVLMSVPLSARGEGNGTPLRAEDLTKVLESGLGPFLNPVDPDDTSTGWITEFWLHLLEREAGVELTGPEWFDRPALTRVTASSPTVLSWFSTINIGRPYADQVKPGNFLLLAHPDPFDPSGLLPFAPFEGDATKRRHVQWFDRKSGDEIRITTAPLLGEEVPGLVRVRSYRDILIDYEGHPEAKSLGPHGEKVEKWTRGLLQRRPVEALMPLHLIGKEANRLDDRVSGVVLDYEDYQTEYANPHDVWATLVVPTLATMDRSEVASRTGVHRRTVERYVSGRAKPQRRREQLLIQLAVDHATKVLREWGTTQTHGYLVTLHRYLQGWPNYQAVCRGCGEVLDGRRRTWCGEACRSRGRSTAPQSED